MDSGFTRVWEAFARCGFSLQERIRLGAAADAPRAGGGGPTAPRPGPSVDLDAWRTRLEKLDLWDERLAALGATREAFLSCAGPPGRPESWPGTPRIRAFVREVLSLCAEGPLARTRRYENGLPPLPPVLERYVDRYLEMRLSEATPIDAARCADLSRLVVDEANFILSELRELLLPSLATELHVATARGDLAGATPEERFDSFCRDCLPSPDWLVEYLESYPVAVRLIEQLVRTRCEGFVELLRRFEADHGALGEACILGPDPAAKLHRLSPARGDRHRGGRTVRVLELTSGVRVVYKPRPAEIDAVFQQSARWLNAKGFEPPLHVMPVVVRDGYGWFPFVEPENCADEAAVGRFYRRHGAHLTLLYLLGGYDFFHNNVRASGEYPVLVDLECVHAPRMPAYNGRLFDSAARRYLEESVIRSGMLPAWNWAYLGDQGVNLSALTLNDGQIAPQDVTEWTGCGTDALRQVRSRRVIRTDHANLTTLEGVPVPVDNFMEHLVAGFRDAYALIERFRDELASEPDGVLAAFAKVDCRLVLRNTVDYQTLLRELRHPRYLADGLRYSELLDRLVASYCPRYPMVAIESEIAQLWSGDVPVFTTRGADLALYDGGGSVVVRDYLEESALDGARRRLARWSPADCARQIEIMNCAFAITELPHVADPSRVRPLSGPDGRDPTRPVPDALIAEASHIADRILDLAIEDEHTLTWIGLGANRAGQWEQTSLDSGLYDGGPGIALFLLYLDEVTGRRRYADAWKKIIEYACVGAARQVLENRARLDDWIISAPTGFMFPYSALYLCIHADRFGGVSDLEPVLDAALEWGVAGLGKKARCDFLNGAAGVARVLLVAYRATGDPRALTLACAYGDQILEHAVPVDPGIGWLSEQYPAALGGFSHGAGGVAWVLADLAVVAGDERYMRAAEAALRYDRSLFSADRDAWFDLRFSRTEPATSAQWCHGAAGIGLSRLLHWRTTGEPGLARDVDRAVEITLDAELSSDCLCHGSLGNIDCCIVAAELLRRPGWRARIDQKVARVWHAAHRRGHWNTGIPGRSIGVCGLFMGTAGIGHVLLRLVRPDLVPSVLYLEEPAPAGMRMDPVHAGAGTR